MKQKMHRTNSQVCIETINLMNIIVIDIKLYILKKSINLYKIKSKA